MKYLFDTSAVLVHYSGEPGADTIVALFEDPENECLVSAPTITEMGRKLAERGLAAEDVSRRLEAYLPLFGDVVAIDESVAKNALVISQASPDRIPLVDSLIAATAYSRGACLVHRDRHMATIPPSVLSQLALPGPGSKPE